MSYLVTTLSKMNFLISLRNKNERNYIMKSNLLLSMVTLAVLSGAAFASPVLLRPGQYVVVQANSDTTTVECRGGVPSGLPDCVISHVPYTWHANTCATLYEWTVQIGSDGPIAYDAETIELAVKHAKRLIENGVCGKYRIAETANWLSY